MGRPRPSLPQNQTYEEFVELYCEGIEPSAIQEAVIRSYLEDRHNQLLWTTRVGYGKSNVVGWLRKAERDRGYEIR